MKKTIMTLALMFLFASQVKAVVVYTDEIPKEHLKEAKTIQNVQRNTIKEDLSQLNEIKIYSKYKRYVQGQFITNINKWGFPCEPNLKKYTFKNGVNLYDKVDFLVSEDVYKNGVLYIKKDTVVTGIVTVAEFPLVDYVTMQPSTLKISKFKTTDVNGNSINLSGDFKNTPFELGPLASVMGAPARVPKNKIYTLYFK